MNATPLNTIGKQAADAAASLGIKSLAETCLLVTLTISGWSGRKHDRAASIAAVQAMHAQEDAGRFNKRLVSKDLIQPVESAAAHVREVFYAMTLPWANDGTRILKADTYPQFREAMATAIEKHHSAVQTFLSGYEIEQAAAQTTLGDMFNPADYPNVYDLERRFSVRVRYSPVPAASDFRANVGAANVEAVRAQIETTTQEYVDAAMREVWQRVYDRVKRLIDRVSALHTWDQDEGRRPSLHTSVVSGLDALVEALPALNLTGDPSLDHLHRQLVENLHGLDVDGLKADPGYRRETVAAAESILDAMSAYTG